ncbi:MAG: hypothetical protein JWN70_4062 [Planctomycetaceae bacterium]|nr:hypothetical protein [Planctomycetaceae bacterium]
MAQDGFWNWGRPTIATEAAPRGTTSRRAFLRTVGGAISASLVGCTSKFGLRKCELAADMTHPDLVAHLNGNIDQINAWRCMHVKITPHGGMMLAPSLSANMAVERPRNFRLQASIPTGNLVDLGSNDERFWFWMRNDEEPALLTARHDCLAAAQRQLPMPFEPDWLIEALGVIPLDENEIEFEKHPTDPKRVFFRRKRKAPDGSSVELVSTVDTCRGVIVDHSLSDRTGKIVALANMGEHERDGKTGAILPHHVELAWPLAKVGLKIRMGAIEINPETLSAKQFAMPEIANCPVYDIGGETQQAGHTGRAKV